MKKINLLLVFFSLSSAIFAQDIVGNWLGTLDIMGNKLRLGFTIEKTDTLYKAKMDSPDQGALGLPTSQTTFRNDTLTINADGLGVSYNGVLHGDSIAGTFFAKRASLSVGVKTSRKTHSKPSANSATTLSLQNRSGKIHQQKRQHRACRHTHFARFFGHVFRRSYSLPAADQTTATKPFSTTNLFSCSPTTFRATALPYSDTINAGWENRKVILHAPPCICPRCSSGSDYLRTRKEIDKNARDSLSLKRWRCVAPR